MNKDEVLKRSREQKEDEGVTFIENKGMYYGPVGMLLTFLILGIIHLFIGGHNMNVPFSMMFSYQAAESIGKYSASKKKQDLACGIICVILTVVFLSEYLFIDVLGVITY